MITTIRQHVNFSVENQNFGQKNDRSLTEVLTEVLSKNNYDKVLPIIEYLDKNGEITPKIAESLIGKSKSTAYRYAILLDGPALIEFFILNRITINKGNKLPFRRN